MLRKLFKGGNYSKAETICSNMLYKKRIRNSTTHLPLGYYAKSTEIRWNMIKSYAFLVLIIIIMPTFGFTYLTQVFDNLFKDDTSDANRMWQCFFLADSGKRPFFNYVKFIYSEKATIFCEISKVYLTITKG